MESSVEAQSLSSLTAIAVNPPLRFDEPLIRRLEPLVLYIARVPGSRDVFLTPLKPRKRVVTAEDIQSSLYYFHVKSASDDLLLDPSERTCCMEDGEDVGVFSELFKAHQRKPVGSQRKAICVNSPIQERTQCDGRALNFPRRKPVGHHLAMEQEQKLPSPGADITPLSPRSATVLNTLPILANQASHPQYQREENSFRSGGTGVFSKHSKQAENLIPQNSNPTFTDMHGRYSRDYSGYRHSDSMSQNSCDDIDVDVEAKSNSADDVGLRAWQADIKGTSSNLDLRITAIRRDPSSGIQWNVGTIIDPPSVDVSSEAFHSHGRAEERKRIDRPFFVELHTAGYSKFISEFKLQSQQQELNISEGREIVNPRLGSPRFEDIGNSPEGVFSRRLWAESSRLGRNDMVQKGLRRKNFAFYSPWNGRCEFSTGLDGDSLKCRHGFLSNSSNSSSSSSSNKSPSLPADGSIVVVSELRFNLPMTKAAKRSTTNNYSSLLEGHRPSHDPHHRKFNSLSSVATSSTFRSPSTSSNNDSLEHQSSPYSTHHDTNRLRDQTQGHDYDYDHHHHHYHQRHHSAHDPTQQTTRHERLDLSLAQEHAGGGFAGRQAKLGKLIVHADGLKMLDLIVTANMGLWWRAYERMERAGG